MHASEAETNLSKRIKLVLPCAFHETHSTQKDVVYIYVLNFWSISEVLSKIHQGSLVHFYCKRKTS